MKKTVSPFPLSCCCRAAAHRDVWGWYVIDPARPGLDQRQIPVSGMGATILISLIAAAISILLGLLVALPGLSENAAGGSSTASMSSLSARSRCCRCCSGCFTGCRSSSVDGAEHPDRRVLGRDPHTGDFRQRLHRRDLPRRHPVDRQGSERGRTDHRAELRQTMRYVILPQAIRRILPPLGKPVHLHRQDERLCVGHRHAGTDAARQRTGGHRIPAAGNLHAADLRISVLVLIISAGVRWLERRMGSDERG